ncbi:MAG: hypothetical protein ACTSW4_02015 [Candidatus Ranarchaeia archaeon]
MDLRKRLLESIEEPNLEDLILVEEREQLKTHCGVCGSQLRVQTYYGNGQYYRRIGCPHCKVGGWTTTK